MGKVIHIEKEETDFCCECSNCGNQTWYIITTDPEKIKERKVIELRCANPECYEVTPIELFKYGFA